MKPVDLLLVEDNPGDVALIRQALLEEGLAVTIHLAENGEQALQMAADRLFRPDLIILDLNIPRVSGLSFLEHSKVEAPVVVLSSSSRPDEVRRCYELGAKAFVQKSSDWTVYTHQVAQVIRDWGSRGRRAASAGS